MVALRRTIGPRFLLGLFLSGLILSGLATFVFLSDVLSRSVSTSVEDANETEGHGLGIDSASNDTQSFEKFAYRFTLERNGYLNSAVFHKAFKSDEHKEKLFVNNQLSGLLNIKLVQQGKDKSLFFGNISQLETKQGSYDLGGGELLAPFAFYLNKNGSLTLNEEDMDYHERLKGIISMVLPYLQTVGNTDSFEKWKTREIDAIGRYKSEYIVKNIDTLVTIEKHKLIYDKVNKLPALFHTSTSSTQANIVEHKATIKISANALWASEMLLSERVMVKDGETTISDMPVQFSAIVSGFDPQVMMPETLEELKRLLSATKNKHIDYYKTDKKLSALVAQRSLDEVFEYYYQLAKTDKFLAKDLIINYFRLFPERSIEFVDKIYSDMDHLSTAEEVSLWHALAKAGHQEAQEAYIYALENPEFRQIVQYRAIGHIRAFEQPSRSFIEKLWEIQEKTANSIAGNFSDRSALAKGLLFAIATLSSGEFIDRDIKKDIVQTLEDKLYLASDNTDKVNLVIAAGNTKDATLLDSVSPSLNSPNVTLRSKAFKALSRMPHEAVIDTYLQAYEQIDNTDHQMQFQALKGLNDMALTKSTIDWVSERALQLNNDTETKRLIMILGDNLSVSPVSEKTLRKLLTTEISSQLKSDIYGFIVPS